MDWTLLFDFASRISFVLEVVNLDQAEIVVCMINILTEWAQYFGLVLVVIQGFDYWELSVITLLFVCIKKILAAWLSRPTFISRSTQTISVSVDVEAQTDPSITKNRYGVIYHGPGGGKRQLV